jgi:hypothetical protein
LADDHVLCEVEERLRGSAHEADTITSLAVTNLPSRKPASISRRGREAGAPPDRLADPVLIDGHWVVVGISIGIAFADRVVGYLKARCRAVGPN